ncbi:purine-nucleoside phosphorylase [Christensenella massiliensis]|uniref:Purine nucleoside phosphorylase n=1 Tax=Christensenella massiliensis TaxID=1805714 RepID=A0AAU8A8W5_9FIRM
MKERITIAKNYIESKTEFKPEVIIVLGSGLGDYGNTIESVAAEFSYSEIPGFPVSTAPGHAGKLTFGYKKDKRVALLSGRFHCYEGYQAAETVVPLRTLLMLGANFVILTNAAGGINMDFQAGDLMVITDHINFSAHNALTGPNIEELGPRFPDMSFAYSKRLNRLLDEVAEEKGISLRHGVYGYMVGPSYETPAEIRALRVLGADAVGMSTVHEVVAASHAGAETAAVSCISNLAAGVAQHALTMEEVLEAGKAVASKMRALVDGFLEKI